MTRVRLYGVTVSFAWQAFQSLEVRENFSYAIFFTIKPNKK
jgi:hypothetical protein